jgi:hypothetical protein
LFTTINIFRPKISNSSKGVALRWDKCPLGWMHSFGFWSNSNAFIWPWTRK